MTESIIADAFQSLWECDGAESTAATESTIADNFKAARECDGGEPTAAGENIACNSPQPIRYDDGHDIIAVSTIPGDINGASSQCRTKSFGWVSIHRVICSISAMRSKRVMFLAKTSNGLTHMHAADFN